jgi:glycosyltransferase involved in cell wall biosynthesis
LGGEGIEVICADDASSDASLSFLQELATLLGDRAKVEECDAPASTPKHKKARIQAPAPSEGTDGALSTNPALSMALRAAETADHPSFKDQEEPEDIRRLRENPVTPQQVAAACRKENRLRVLKYKDGVNRGQGAAMTLCLSRVKTPYVAQMESDDEREDADALWCLHIYLICRMKCIHNSQKSASYYNYCMD